MKKNNFLKTLIITILHICITFFTDKYAFGDTIKEHLPMYFFIKTLLFILLFTFYYQILEILKGIKEKNKETITLVKIFAFVFGINFLFSIILFPGNWLADEIDIFKFTKELNIFYWQGWLSSIFFMLSRSLFPVPYTVVFLQILIISAIISYITNEFYKIYKNKFIFMLPIFLSFPVFIAHNLFTQRCSILAYFELFLLATLYFWYKKGTQISNKSLIIFTIFTILFCSWRSETIFSFIIFSLVLLTFKSSQIRKKIVIIYLIICSFFISVFTFIQIKGLNEQNHNGASYYKFVSLMPTIANTILDDNYPQYLKVNNQQIIQICSEIKKDQQKVWEYEKELTEDTINEIMRVSLIYLKKDFTRIAKQKLYEYATMEKSFLVTQANDYKNNPDFSFLQKDNNAKIVSLLGATEDSANNKSINILYKPIFYTSLFFIILLFSLISRNIGLFAISVFYILHSFALILSVPTITISMYFFFSFVGAKVFLLVALIDIYEKFRKHLIQK